MNKQAGRSNLRAKHIAIAVAAAFAPWSAYGQTPPSPNTLPTGGTITQGSGTIHPAVHTPTVSTLQIDQTSASMAARFTSLSIGELGHVTVSQPSSSSIALLRDVGGSLTQIYGRLTANGQLFISNQNGVLFGSTARIEVGSLFATNLSIDETEFMEGRYKWYNDGSTGTVTNHGTIITPSGYAVLAGTQVRNDGVIIARTGSVVLAAGDRVSLDLIGDGLISVSVDQAALNASAINTGTIEAEGGTVMLTARSANALLDTVVNAGGTIRATSLIERNGEIVLDGGGAGLVNVAGRHEAGSATVSGAAITINGRITTGPGTGSQTITTPGALTIEAGTAGDAGMLHNGSGEQRITAGSLVMRGGTGTDSRAIVTSGDAAADQNITVAGDVTMTGGSAGTRNLAIIRAFGDQTIDAGSLTLTIGAGGVDNAAVVVAPRQTISTSGDVRLNGGGATGNVAARIGGLSVASAGVDTPANLELNVGNDLVLAGGPGPVNQALIGGAAGQPQSIRIQTGRDVVLGATGNSVARIGNGPVPTPGDVTINAGRDVQVNGSGEILSGGTMTVTAGRAVNVNATSTSAFTARISSTTGQTIEAQSVAVTAQNSRLAQITNTAVGEQRITTTGNVEVQTLGPGGGTAEIRNGAGLQTLTVGGEQLTLRGMGGGQASIASSGDQTINMTASGPKSITIGDHAAQGSSIISSGGDQKILGYADITLTGGSGPVANGSNALILATNPTRTQRVEARNLSLANSNLGGNSSVAGIQGAHQSIHALGNVMLTAGASGGTLPGVRIGGLAGTGATSTDLVLTVGGDLVLTGGTAAGNSVAIGTTAAPPAGAPLANNITIDAAGNVILNAGTLENTGVRIGNSLTAGDLPGDITVRAGGAIAMNGTAQTAGIRTLGNVTLEAASISQGTNGLIAANTLTTTTTGATNLTGANDVARFNATSGGPVTLLDAGSLRVTGVSTTNDTITLTTDSLTNEGVITNGGASSTANIILNADSFNLAGGTVEGGAGAVVMRPRTGTNSFGIEAAGQTTLTNADIATIHTSDFVVFGSSTGTIFTGNMTIGENARVEGNGKNLSFSRSLTPGAEMITIGSQGVATTGDVIIGAGGGGIRSNGGTVTGDEVQLRATNGIGTPGARVKTAANALAFTNAGGSGVFVSELDNVTLRTISLSAAGGIITSNNIISGSLDLVTGGDLNVAGLVSSAGSMIVNAGGNLNLDGTAVDAMLVSNGGQAVSARSINMTAANGRRANIENVNGNQTVTATAGGISLQVPGGFGVAQIVNTSNLFPGDQTVSAAGQIDVLGGVVTPTTSRNSGIFKNGPGGLQTVRASGITLQGASTGTSAGALISSQGNQLVDVTGGTINLRGGNGGTGNSATIAAAATGQQTIRAHDINLSNGFGGTDTIAGIVGGHQLIDATGNVTLTAQGSLVSPSATALPGVRIGAPGGSTTGTDLTLLVGGNLVLNGGSAANNGASIGSSGAGVAQQNTVVIDAGGSVILNSGTAPGTGARIGSSSENGLAGGNISIKAGGATELNGAASATAIRTLGSVTVEAASISQGSNGFVQASTLTTNSTSGNTTLTGPNQVSTYNGTSSADLTLNNSGPLTVTGVDAAGNASLTNALGDVNLVGRWRSATASITAGGALLQSGGGFFQAGSLTTHSAGASLTGPNVAGAFNGTSTGDLIFNNSGALTITGLDASGNAAVTNFGDVTLTGAWSSASADIRSNGFGSAIREAGAGAIETGSLTTSSEGATSLTGANQVASFDGVTSFGGTGGITLNNTGVLTVIRLATGGDAALTNNGAVNITGAWSSSGVTSIATTGGDLTVTNSLRSNGAMDLDVGGRLVVSANGPQAAFVTGLADQTVRAQGLEVTSQSGGFATLETQGHQRITVTGGSVDVQVLNGLGTAQIVGAPGRSQTVQVIDGDHINVNGRGGFAAIITAPTGTQEVSITGSGANAITLGSAGAIGSSQIVGGSQNVTAGAEGQNGSITITGTSANGRFAGLSTQPTTGGTQTVSTSGLLRVAGGNASAQNLSAGLFHGGSGAQTVNAARIELEGGAAGNGNGALIVSNGGNVPANAGAQNINASGDLIITGGAGGSAGITGPATRLQTIRAQNIHMTNSVLGGINSVGFILGGHQDIHARGHLTMTAHASGGDSPGVRIGGLSGSAATATDLMLTVGGDLILTGGTVAGNGVGIGSTAASGPAFANHITIDAGGDVILNSGSVEGTAVRIGSSATTGAAEGDIRITAGGDIRLNGVVDVAAIRTLGNVTLEAARITEAERGLIEAAALSTRTSGDALLTGSNRVSAFTASSDHGNVHLTNGAPVLTLGAMDLPGNLTVVQTGDLAVGSASATQSTVVAAAGDVSMSASGQILVRGSDTTAGAGSAVLAGGDLSFSAGDVTLLAGNAALTPVVVRGADGVEMTVGNELRVTGGRGLLSPTLLTSGGDIELTIGQALRVDAGAGLLSIARVQLESHDGVIRLTFPNLTHGGYFVNGIEGRTHQGQTGFYRLLKPAKVGKSLLIDYGG